HSHGLIDGYMKMPVVQFEVGERAIARGSADAPVQIVVFTDFDCPYCKKFEPVLRKALEKYPGEKYRLIYKMYPLGKCNPIMKGQKGEHKNACRLAEMAQALGAMGKFWEAGENLHELAGRAELYPGLKDLAAKGGFDYLQWVAKLDDPAIREQVNRDIMEGVKLQIIALPAIFINGRYVKSLEPNNFDLLLKYIFDSAAK
ncbi:thioredoxin domain-containing protein, partial [Candidatus Sumerlaeota bacterium]|nr:thioredoxin domain-containing protein [Candidatus Sumerlaeota bacterium]